MKAVDLFSGSGGFSEGARQAGAHVVYAANHWPLAVAAHELNHPETRHECQDLRQADWTKLPRYDLLLASPACQGHSTASQPKRRAYHDVMRATAWAVVDCADVTEPAALVVENVPSFKKWRLFPEWRASLLKLGYHLQEHVLVASEISETPQRRERLFIVGTRKRAPVLSFKRHAEPAFGPHLEPDAGGWKPWSAATEGAQARFAKGRANHGRTFLSQHVTDHPGVPLHEPIRTITTIDGHWVLVDGNRYRALTKRELMRAMGFRDSYRWPEGAKAKDVAKLAGNAVPPPMARELVKATMKIAA